MFMKENREGDFLLGLYIHIPFCVQKCKYCDFNSYKMIVNERDVLTMKEK